MAKKRKDKTASALLAIFGGFIGLHRFYLGQVGLGILYVLIPGAWLLSLIDATIFLTQDEDKFDYKYNRDLLTINYDNNYETDFNRRRQEEKRRRRIAEEEAVFRAEQIKKRRAGVPVNPNKGRKAAAKNEHKKNGIAKYKEYDFEGSIEEFKKSLQIYYQDVAVHFNLACAYSITEDTKQALFHLDKSVEYGFNDFAKIKEHDALAYLRIQPAFESFIQNGYRLEKQVDRPIEKTQSVPEAQKKRPQSEDLLEQLRKLGELKERGLLTEEEFQTQKEKLLK